MNLPLIIDWFAIVHDSRGTVRGDETAVEYLIGRVNLGQQVDMPEKVGHDLGADGIKVVPHADVVREVNHQLVEFSLERIVRMCIGFEEAGYGIRTDGITIVDGLLDGLVSFSVTGVGIVAAGMELSPNLLIGIDDGGLGPVERWFRSIENILNCLLI